MSKNRNGKLKFEKRSKTEISPVSVLNFPFMYYNLTLIRVNAFTFEHENYFVIVLFVIVNYFGNDKLLRFCESGARTPGQ